MIWNQILRAAINPLTSEAVFSKTLKQCIKVTLLWFSFSPFRNLYDRPLLIPICVMWQLAALMLWAKIFLACNHDTCITDTYISLCVIDDCVDSRRHNGGWLLWFWSLVAPVVATVATSGAARVWRVATVNTSPFHWIMMKSSKTDTDYWFVWEYYLG